MFRCPKIPKRKKPQSFDWGFFIGSREVLTIHHAGVLFSANADPPEDRLSSIFGERRWTGRPFERQEVLGAIRRRQEPMKVAVASHAEADDFSACIDRTRQQ